MAVPHDNSDDERTLRFGKATSVSAERLPSPSAAGGDSECLPEGMRLAEFEITGFIGEGGFSIVYLAWDHSLERNVALKEYMPSSLAARSSGTRVFPRSERHRETFELGLRSFINEARLLAQFDHPSLVKVYRFWEDHGTAYMVMPYYEGVTLKEAVRAMAQPPDERWLRGLLDPLTAALTVIHDAHCYHRDIAPDNVLLLEGSGKPLLLDFGAARRVIGDKTQALTVILKPGYAPVEQYAEDATMRQGAWTDVYALAAVIYWMVTGKTPPISVGRLLSDTYVPLAQCAAGRYGAGFLAAVDRALAVKPSERTPSVARLREELRLDAAPLERPDAATQLRDAEATVVRMPPAASPVPKAPASAPRKAPAAPSVTSAETRVAAHTPRNESRTSRRPRRLLAGVTGAVVTMAAAWWIVSHVEEPAPPAPINPLPPSAPPATDVSAPSVPPPPAVPATPPSADAVLSQIASGRDAAMEVQATLVTERNGASVQYRAREPGHAYVMGLRGGSNELVIVYPPQGTPVPRSSSVGRLEVPLPATSGVSAYFLLWAREGRSLPDSGWRVRDRWWVRDFSADAGPIEASAVWGTPQCADRTARCDAAYAMTEVIDMTNVTTPVSAPAPPAIGDRSTPPRASEKPVVRRSETAPPTQRKPASKGSEQTSAQCRDLFNRASLGETSPELIEAMKTLRCGA